MEYVSGPLYKTRLPHLTHYYMIYGYNCVGCVMACRISMSRTSMNKRITLKSTVTRCAQVCLILHVRGRL